MTLDPLQQYLHQHYTPTTAQLYLETIQSYVAHNARAAQYHYADITRYIGVLRGRYPNIRTLKRIVASIKVYYRYLSASGYRSDNPAASIVLKDQTARAIQLQDLFSREELDALLVRKERYPLLAVRNKVLIGLLIYQALLPKEIAALKVSDIDLEAGTLWIGAQPGTNSRTLPLQSQQILLVFQYIHQTRQQLLKAKQHPFLVLSSRGSAMTADQITKHIGASFRNLYAPRKVTPTTIRQSVITLLLAQNNNLRAVQVFAGHKNPSTTEQYKQSNTKALAEQINRYHPIQ